MDYNKQHPYFAKIMQSIEHVYILDPFKVYQDMEHKYCKVQWILRHPQGYKTAKVCCWEFELVEVGDGRSLSTWGALTPEFNIKMFRHTKNNTKQ